MARVSDRLLMQQIDGDVVLFEDHTEVEYVRFDPNDTNAVAQAQGTIHHDSRMTDEEKSFAHFWSAYFYAHTRTSDQL